MLDQNKINQFTLKAKAAGFSDAQIVAEIERKKKELATPTPSQPISQPVSGGLDLQNPGFQETKPAPIQREKPKGVMGFLDSATEFLFPRAKKMIRKVVGSATLGKQTTEIEKTNKELQNQADHLLKLAKIEKDPTKKAMYLKQSKELGEQSTRNIEDLLGGFEKSTGLSRDLKNEPSVGAEALGVAGEIGTFLAPVSKAKAGAGFVGKVAAGVKTGAKIGAIQGLTTPEKELTDVKGRLYKGLVDAGFGAMTGGIMTAAYEIPKEIIKKALNTEAAQNTIRGIFKIVPSEMKKFRKVNGMDFGEEILARDGKSIAGMNHEQMAEYMAGRKDQAQKIVKDALKGSTKKINTSEVLTAIDEKIKALDPKKGNVNTEGAISTLKTIKETLKKNPKVLDLVTANNIKRQLQTAGKAAYSPTNSPTPSSEAFAEVAGQVRKMIENKAKSVKEGNKLIQLYSLAEDSILKQGDANVNKVRSGNFQKFIQNIPTVAGAGLGFAVGGIPGGAAGIVGGNIISGLQGSIRNKMLSPEIQSRIAAAVQTGVKAIENPTTQEIKKITDTVVQEMVKQLTRSATSGVGTTPPMQEGQESNLSTNNQNENSNQIDHTQSVVQPGMDINNPSFQPVSNQPKPITGHTVEEHLKALSAATAAGDKAAIKQIESQLAIEQEYDKTSGKKLSAVEQSKVNEARGGLALVDTIDKTFSEIQDLGLAAKGGGLSRIRGLKGYAASITQEGNEGEAAAAYENTKEAFLSKLSRASGEKGVLTDQDIARIRKALPKFTDAPGTVTRQLNLIREIIGAAITAKEESPLGMEESLGGFGVQ